MIKLKDIKEPPNEHFYLRLRLEKNFFVIIHYALLLSQAKTWLEKNFFVIIHYALLLSQAKTSSRLVAKCKSVNQE